MSTEDHDEMTNNDPCNTAKPAAMEAGAIKHAVSWADGQPHYLGTSTDSTHTAGADQEPLGPKFSEEGSSAAAVLDESCQILSNQDSATGPSIDITVPGVHHSTNLRPTKSAQDCSCVSTAAEGSTQTTMGTKVVDANYAGIAATVSLDATRSGEEEDEAMAHTHDDVESYEEAIDQGVLISPSLVDNLIDQVCLARSVSNDSEDVGIAPTFSDDSADVKGIILPPSMSPKNKKSSPTVTPTSNNCGMKYIQVYTSYSATQLMSLPMDSLHCIASFLTPLEWAQYGQTCKAASNICREIFRRVRMHGFKCATEVVSAWKLDQHADARELAALYISSGVPIYPFSMGHSYQTICWRMGVEAKNMEEKAQAAAESSRPSDQSTEEEDNNSNNYAIDRFFSERNLGTRDVSHVMCSYLEDKCMYLLGPTQGSPAGSPISAANRWNSMTNLPRELGLAGDPFGHPPAVARLDGRPLANLSPLSSPATSPSRSKSQTDLRAKNRAPKTTVQIHRHLLDQHLLGRSSVDDKDEKGDDMMTAPISLSADFFHPHLCVHSISTRSRPLGQPNTPPSRGVASPNGAGDENLLEDPGFQAWAVRAAAATANGRIGGAALQDAEELAELQDLYTQLFAVDRNATGGEGDVGLGIDAANLLPATPTPQTRPAVVTPNSTAVSFDDLSTLYPRHGYSSILNSVDLEVYSASTASAKDTKGDIKGRLLLRFAFYQRRLEVLLSHGDSSGYEECMLDFWDEFFPLTAKIHYYDGHTAIPRISSLQQFLTQPCPKEIGIVQCEIERVKISSKKRKGVSMKGRLFPTYEYRLFIKDRLHTKPAEEGENQFDEDLGPRRDTVLMVAKNRGRKHVDTSGVVSLTPAAKKGANNYYLYTPQQADVDTHYNALNETEETGNRNGVSLSSPPLGTTPPVLLGRLQSNFIGTEFQIYTPKLRKSRPGGRIRRCNSLNDSPTSFEEEVDYDSGFASDTGTPSRRRSRFGRLSLRRASSQASSPATAEQTLSPASSRSRSRSRSRPETPVVKPSRMNRRAIANSSEEAPDAEQDAQLNQEPFLCEEEDGVITYTANLLGSRPRIMDVCIPKITPDGQIGGVWRNYLDNHEEPEDCAPYNRMLHCFKQLQQRLDTQNENDRPQTDENGEQTDDFGLLALQNRPPWWNIELGSFVLNFRGRVSVASVKNFQLCDRNDHDHIMLQFGRIEGRHSFTMDYQYPLTAVQAFSIAISSLQSKISFG